MTELYDALKQRPQTGITKNNLPAHERMDLRKIKVSRARGSSQTNTRGDFTTVYYLDGDEKRAAEVFVEENRDILDAVDFSKRDAVQTSVSRGIYDWILHALGEREITKYDSVVLETRPDGTQWLIERQLFDDEPNARYRRDSDRRVCVTCPLTELFDAFDDVITESDLDAHDDVSGDTRYLLDYFRLAEEFPCTPISADGELAVRKDAEPRLAE